MQKLNIVKQLEIKNINTMKMKRNYLSMTIILSFGLVFSSCNNIAKKADNKAVHKKKAVSVEVKKVKETTIERTINYTGNIMPFKEAYYAPASPGKIEKIFVEAGDYVKKGQLLAQMDKTKLLTTKVQLITLKKNLVRLDSLLIIGSVSQQQYDQLKSQYDVIKENYNFLLDNVNLKAPFNGIIAERYYNQGELFNAAPNTPVGKAAIFLIQQIKPIKIIINVSSQYFRNVKKGQIAKITSDIYPDETLNGKVNLIYPTIDNMTKTFKVEIITDNKNKELRPGMFCKVKINLKKTSAILIPNITIIKQIGTNDKYVFINKNNIAIKKKVKIGVVIDDKSEIVSGLNLGDELIVTGADKLMEQSPVTIVK